jgi:hypothetical protein
MRNITRALAATAGAAVIGVGTAVPASAQDATTAASGRLIAKGVAGAVQLTFTCDWYNQYSLNLSLTQWSSSTKTTVRAYGSANSGFAPCPTGADSNAAKVTVIVYTGDGQRLKAGSALGVASIYVCDAWYIDCWGPSTTNYVVKLK